MLPVLGVAPRWALFDLPDAAPLVAGTGGLVLRSTRRDGPPDAADWGRVELAASVVRERAGVAAETYRLYRVIGRNGGEPIVVMPRPR